MDIRDYINNLVKNSFFWTKIHNVKDVSDPIVKAIKEKPELDPNDISEPIVGALDELKDAVDGIEIPNEITVKNFPEFPEQKDIDFTPLISVLQEELGKLEAKEVDTKSVVESVRSVEKRIAEFKFPEKEEKDYSSVLNKIVEILETPEEKEGHQDIIEALSPLSRTEDISALADWLKAIYEKEDEHVPFKFDDEGRLLVKVDRVGGGSGGGGGTSNLYDTAGTQINPATEEKQDAMIAALGVPISTTITEYTVTMTNANTEYSQALPANTKMLQFRCRGLYDVRYSFTTGKVATPTNPYQTLLAGLSAHDDKLNLSSKTLYLACGTAGQVVEMTVYT